MYILGLGRISGSAGLSGRIFHFAGYPACRIIRPAVAGYPAGYPASGIFYEKHPASGIRQLPDIRQSGRVLNEKSNYFSGFKMTFAATDYKTCKQDAQDHV